MRQRVYPGVFIIALLLCGSTAALAQTCMSASITASTPTADFKVHGDGTVTDNKTRLLWKVCPEGMTWHASGTTCTGSATNYLWGDALYQAQTVNGIGFAGYTAWRVPNKKELDSIVEVQCFSPAINATIFPATNGVYWSASPSANIGGYAWHVLFGTGIDGIGSALTNGHVRLVHDGQ